MLECELVRRDFRGGEVVRLGKPDWIIASSSSCPWRNSFRVEHHLGSGVERGEYAVRETHISIFGDAMRQSTLMEWRIAGSAFRRSLVQPGDVHIMAEGARVSSLCCFGPIDILVIAFNRDFLATAAGDSAGRRGVELKSLFHTVDSQIRAFGSLLQMEVRAGCPSGHIYCESLGMALAAYALRNYAVGPPRTVGHRGGLPKYRLRQVLDYIQSNLGEDHCLQDLAALAELSRFHFCRSFKQSTGLSPHRFILQVRIEEAKRLLGGTKLRISEIGKRLGFSDQSHFTMIFRKFVGTTPARWRGSA